MLSTARSAPQTALSRDTTDRHPRALPSNLDKNEDRVADCFNRVADCFNMAGLLVLSVVRTFSTLTA